MKTKLFALLGLLAATSFCLAAPVGKIAEPARVDFVEKKGNWKDGRNWSTKKTPQGFVRVHVNDGRTAFINSAVPQIYHVGVYGKKEAGAGTLVIEEGANLKIDTFAMIWGNSENSQSAFEMKGGQLTVCASSDEGAFLVGTGGTFSGNSVATISGGKIIGPLLVGSTLRNTHVGRLVMNGSKGAIIAGKYERSYFLINPSATLEFIFDEKGVGAIDYTESPSLCRLEPGATVIIDGSKYKGGSKTIPLLTARRVDDNGARIEVKGFDSSYQTEVLKLHSKLPGVYLKIVKK